MRLTDKIRAALLIGAVTFIAAIWIAFDIAGYRVVIVNIHGCEDKKLDINN